MSEPSTIVTSNKLRELLELVAHAVADQDEPRTELQGICIDTTNDRLRIAAADGYRAAWGRLVASAQIEEPVSVVANAQGILQAAVCFPYGSPISLVLGRGYARLIGTPAVQGDIPPDFTLINRPPPNIDKVIPTNEPACVIRGIEARELCEAVRAMASLAEHTQGRVSLATITGGTVRLAASVEIGNGKRVQATFDVPARIHGHMHAYMRWSYLADVLSAAKSDVIEIRTQADVSAPIHIVAENSEFLIMPICPRSDEPKPEEANKGEGR